MSLRHRTLQISLPIRLQTHPIPPDHLLLVLQTNRRDHHPRTHQSVNLHRRLGRQNHRSTIRSRPPPSHLQTKASHSTQVLSTVRHQATDRLVLSHNQRASLPSQVIIQSTATSLCSRHQQAGHSLSLLASIQITKYRTTSRLIRPLAMEMEHLAVGLPKSLHM